MHEVHKLVSDEIKCIAEKGICKGNVELLGMLVDIRKDIEEMWYWKSKEEKDETESIDIKDTKDKKLSLDELMDEVVYLNKKMKTGMTRESEMEMKSKLSSLVEYAEKMRGILESLTLDEEFRLRVRKIFNM